MRVVLFGASGMVGQGVLRECLLATDVSQVLLIGRSALGVTDAKVREIVLADVGDLSSVREELAGLDACFFCLGVSSAGMKEEAYTRVTYELTMRVAHTLVEVAPQMVFVYVSGAGTDSSEKGRSMWARVKGATENALLAMSFRGAYMFRPGLIQPMYGIRSKTPAYQAVLTVFGWLIPAIRKMFPKSVTTTEKIGLAMLQAVRKGYPKKVLDPEDINTLAG